MKPLLSLLGLIVVSTCLAQTDPAKEFVSGGKAKFNSKSHPKAKGIELSIEYPRSWSALEGERPNIVQKFVSESGRGLEMAIITIKPLPLPPSVTLSKEDLDEVFSPQGLREMLPQGANLIESKKTKIDDQTAGYCFYLLPSERANLKLLMSVQSYVFFYQGNLVFVAFQVSEVDGEKAALSVGAKVRRFETLFRLMANSIIVHNQYR